MLGRFVARVVEAVTVSLVADKAAKSLKSLGEADAVRNSISRAREVATRAGRAVSARWVAGYNLRRPHSALGYLMPAVYAANLTARTIGRATPTSSADLPVLHRRGRANLRQRFWRQSDDNMGSHH